MAMDHSKVENNRMPFTKGRKKTGGRQLGTPNKFTGTFREAVQVVYEGLGGHAAFLRWARENPSEYYKIAARLIPTESEEIDANKPKRIFIRKWVTLAVERQQPASRTIMGCTDGK
jgi:hypothetical protein